MDNNQTATTDTVETPAPAAPAKKRPILPIVLGVLALLGGYWGYSKYSFGQHHEETDDAQFEGSISPIIPRIGGYVTKVKVVDNQLVKAGDTLVTLDDRDLRIKLQQAEAALLTAQANSKATEAVVRSAGEGTKTFAANSATATAGISTTQAAIATAQANVDAAKVRVWKTTQDYNRYQALYGLQSATKQQLEAVQADKEGAEATLVVAQKQLESARTQLTVTERQAQAAQQQQTASAAQTDATAQNTVIAQATVKQRQADVDFAKLQLSYTVITAPANGKISRKNVQVGQQIGQGQNLCSIVSGNEIWVVANFKETQLTRVHEGQSVDLVADAFKDVILKGKIQSIQDATGARFALLPPDNASGNFVKVVQRIPVKIILDEVPKIAIKPGMNVHTTINLD